MVTLKPEGKPMITDGKFLESLRDKAKRACNDLAEAGVKLQAEPKFFNVPKQLDNWRCAHNMAAYSALRRMWPSLGR